MESDELPLETLLGKYEEGSELVRVCRDKLEKAELRIQELDGTASGEAELRDIRDDDEAQE
ncbi:MAG: exodeoxyribonuclease VII small subunit [Verrucomicrobia bacterium]|nr:exodeoxyribonuclease VII small subunit [Verrucomicrobiota bacterium]MCF7708883.1 exodeoxyribonuclease VII small subunit [Verrucomicrobiota bacterium]